MSTSAIESNPALSHCFNALVQSGVYPANGDELLDIMATGVAAIGDEGVGLTADIEASLLGSSHFTCAEANRLEQMVRTTASFGGRDKLGTVVLIATLASLRDPEFDYLQNFYSEQIAQTPTEDTGVRLPLETGRRAARSAEAIGTVAYGLVGRIRAEAYLGGDQNTVSFLDGAETEGTYKPEDIAVIMSEVGIAASKLLENPDEADGIDAIEANLTTPPATTFGEPCSVPLADINFNSSYDNIFWLRGIGRNYDLCPIVTTASDGSQVVGYMVNLAHYSGTLRNLAKDFLGRNPGLETTLAVALARHASTGIAQGRRVRDAHANLRALKGKIHRIYYSHIGSFNQRPVFGLLAAGPKPSQDVIHGIILNRRQRV